MSFWFSSVRGVGGRDFREFGKGWVGGSGWSRVGGFFWLDMLVGARK